jgi:hypothetical protein
MTFAAITKYNGQSSLAWIYRERVRWTYRKMLSTGWAVRHDCHVCGEGSVDYGRHPRRKNQLRPYVSSNSGKSEPMGFDRLRLKAWHVSARAEDPAVVQRRRKRVRKVLAETSRAGDEAVDHGTVPV